MRNYGLVSVLVCLLHQVIGDIYMHMPRGSNNRNNEDKRERNNAKRLFDSQNNNRGGYNRGNQYHHVGSVLQVQWTNQHSCGDENTDCDVIIQYACGDLIRDGEGTETIPRNPAQCNNNDCNNDRKYGMHEDFYAYKHCRMRERNKGLFTSDQNVKEGAYRTRQENAGTQYGYECTEERDYYPYWHPTIWKDVAVFTNDISRCEYYQRESQNVKARYYCKVDNNFLYQNNNNPPGNKYIPITKTECESFTYKGADNTDKTGKWVMVESHGIAAPQCLQSQYSRDNHLGNTYGGETPNYNWTIPNDVNQHCVMRIRYNITSGEYDRDNTNATHNNAKEGQNGPDVWTRHGFTASQGVARGYKLVDDPNVDVFGEAESKFKLQVAIDTSQFGRTFQDRSHTFAISKRPDGIPTDAVIRNLNVRGKRGNIVQVFPAVEYDFTPNTLMSSADDYIHIQWTGSNKNPANNAGQGKAQTDRSNVVLLKGPSYDEGHDHSHAHGNLGSSYPEHLDNVIFGGIEKKDLINLALSGAFGGDLDELDDAKPYYDLKVQKVTKTGDYNYMCTRNNNFSNRSQKGKIQIINGVLAGSQVDKRGGSVRAPVLSASGTVVQVPPRALSVPKYIELREEPNTVDFTHEYMTAPPHNDFISKLVTIEPQEMFSRENPLTVRLDLHEMARGLYNVYVYRTQRDSSLWHQMEVDQVRGGQVIFKTSSGGTFVAVKSLNVGHLVAVIVGSLAALILLIVVFMYFRKTEINVHFQDKF